MSQLLVVSLRSGYPNLGVRKGRSSGSYHQYYLLGSLDCNDGPARIEKVRSFC